MSTTTVTADPTPEPPTEERRHPRSWTEAPRLTVLLFAAVFVLLEIIGAFINIGLQAVLTGIAALFSVNYAVFGYRTSRTAGLVMAALFTTRLMALTLPLVGVSITTRVGMLAVPMVLVSYVATWVLGVDITGSRVDEGYPLRKPLVSQSFTTAITIASGFPIGYLGHHFLHPAPLVINPAVGSSVVPWLVAVGALILGALSEELLYRRLVAAMVQHTGQSQTPWISAALYGSVFLGTRNPGFIVLAFLSGAFFAWSCERTGTVRAVVTAHAIASILIFVLLSR